MTELSDATHHFIRRCDNFAERRRIKRSTLSAWLFNDGRRLDQLAAGKSDVGVQRLSRAVEALSKLEQDAA